ncbi:MAG: hypothetical protein ABIH03_04030 [Pseudomonadota bacterium]
MTGDGALTQAARAIQRSFVRDPELAMVLDRHQTQATAILDESHIARSTVVHC